MTYKFTTFENVAATRSVHADAESAGALGPVDAAAFTRCLACAAAAHERPMLPVPRPRHHMHMAAATPMNDPSPIAPTVLGFSICFSTLCYSYCTSPAQRDAWHRNCIVRGGQTHMSFLLSFSALFSLEDKLSICRELISMRR